MTLIFNPEILRDYISQMGRSTMFSLWEDYIAKNRELLEKSQPALKRGDWAELRIIYHSLKSSSAVFGLDKFVELCTKVEEAIISGKKDAETSNLICNSLKLWEESLAAAATFWKKV